MVEDEWWPERPEDRVEAETWLNEGEIEGSARVGVGAEDVSHAVAWSRLRRGGAEVAKSFREEGVRLALY